MPLVKFLRKFNTTNYFNKYAIPSNLSICPQTQPPPIDYVVAVLRVTGAPKTPFARPEVLKLMCKASNLSCCTHFGGVKPVEEKFWRRRYDYSSLNFTKSHFFYKKKGLS